MNNFLFGNLLQGLTQNIMQMLPGIKQNPAGILGQNGFNIPGGMNNPNQILQHLISSGQLNQNQLDYAQSLARSMGIKI